jgi:uncharacterized membrane protein
MINRIKMGTMIIIISIILIVMLGIIKMNIGVQEAFLCEAVHSHPDLGIDQCPVHTSNTSWPIDIAFGIAFLILGIGLYIVFTKGRILPTEPPSSEDISKLDKDERRIYDILKQNKGSAFQGHIVKETGFSKVKTTRILDRMENRHIIERKRRGMANVVVLK